MKPICSVVMPTFNSAAHVEAAMNSVSAQTFQNWELVVSDDGSSDDTIAIVQQLIKRDSRARLITSVSNCGPAGARNAAIMTANGRYIAFLDSDDLWKPEKLEKQIALMQERDLAFTFSSYDRIDEEGIFINTHYVDRPVSYHDLLKSNVIGCLTAMYDTEKLGKILMPDIRKRQDFGLWLGILKRVDFAFPVPESLAQYRVRKGSVSASKLQAAGGTWSVYRTVEKLNLAESVYYFSHYAGRGIFDTYVRPLLRSQISKSGGTGV